MIDNVSGYFLSLVTHSTIIFTIFYNQEPYLQSSLPSSVDIVPEQRRVHFAVVLSLTLLFALLEFLFLLRQLPSFPLAFFSILLHTVACIFLFKFIVDIHPSNHFFYLFIICSVPPVIVHLTIFFMSYRLNRIC